MDSHYHAKQCFVHVQSCIGSSAHSHFFLQNNVSNETVNMTFTLKPMDSFGTWRK